MSENTIDHGLNDFDIDAHAAASSGEAFSARVEAAAPSTQKGSSGKSPAGELSPIFEILAQPQLPELGHDEARARLMIQSPTRLYFYWSIGAEAYQSLKSVVRDIEGYQLALRLLNLESESEEIYAIEPEGSWWFTVAPGAEYRAEVGFYSTSRPFVRVLFSNTVATPRKSPSPRSASESRWAVTTHAFAEVLDASGFEEDAVDVIRSEQPAMDLRSRFAYQMKIDRLELDQVGDAELIAALEHLSAGAPIEDLKWRVGAVLFAILQAGMSKLTADAIEGDVGLAGQADATDYRPFTAVGGSLVNFPRRRYRPVSSINIR
jgi:hypothetical protein